MNNKIVNFFVSRLEAQKNVEKAIQMEKYMKGIQPYLGVQTPQRKEVYKEFKKSIGKELKQSISHQEVLDTALNLWNRKEREYRSVALFILEYFDAFTIDQLDYIRNLIISGAWWDTTDSIAPHYVGNILKNHRKKMTSILKNWVHDENLWIRRSAILSQLKFKDETDTELLEYCIVNTMQEKEFFIQKAIGWILREYSKTDNKYVASFIDQHKSSLSKLSIREGSKYLK